MRVWGRLALIAGLCGAMVGIASSTAAQVSGGDGQDNGPYAVKGLPLGGFRLFPTLNVTANYDDNVYRTQTTSSSDYFFDETPGFVLQSEWGRHELDLYGQLNSFQYSTLTSENHSDWNLGGNTRLDLGRGMGVAAGGSYAIAHELRTSVDQPGFAKSPTEYAETQAHAAYEYHPYHFGFEVGGNYTRFDYSPTTLIGYPPLNNDDRNRDEYNGYMKLSYEFSPGYAVYVLGNDRDVSYDLLLDRSGLNRSNSGYSVDTGLEMAVTDLIQGEAFIGYLSENYHAPLVNISGFNFGANVDWEPTPLWTFHLTASRVLNGTTINGASAEDDQSVRLVADYQARPNIVVTGYVGYTDANFNGTSRQDNYTSAGLKLNYLMNHNVSAQLGYDFQTRSSSIGGQNFNDNVVSIGLNLHL